MERFSKLKPKSDIIENEDDNILWSNDHMKIIQYEDWSILKECDFVACIIYLIEMNQIIIRQEYVPTYKYTDGQEYHITILSGCIEVGETPQMALIREIEEEAGIVISPEFKIEFMRPLHVSKSHTSKYHPAIITLTERDYHEVVSKGDGSKEEQLSKSIKVDVKYINSIVPSDLITEFMLIKIKEHLNIL